jgi:glycosyltransferase involved in cell wall biosynthesis
MNPKILIIIPAHNEGASIGKLIREISSVFPQADALVVNDASRDHTAVEVEKAGAFSADLPFNLGIGGAVQTGYQFAKEQGYDIAVQVDGDGQHDPAYLSDLIRPVAEGKLDLCIGSRFLDKNAPSFRSTPLRRIGILFFCRLLGTITGLSLTDPTSGFRAAGRMLIEKFAVNYPVDFPEPEAIQLAKHYRARIGEITVCMRDRQGGHSSIRHLKTLYYMIKVTIAILLNTLKIIR